MNRVKTAILATVIAALTPGAIIPARADAPSAASAFTDAPIDMFPIDKLTRLDMIDYYNNGSTKPSKNMFKGDCRITALSPEQITVEASNVADITISLLQHKADTLFMVISTYKTPIADSAIHFYNKAWTEQQNLFNAPELADWLTAEVKADKQRQKDVENACPFILATYSYSPADATLTITNNVDAMIPREDKQIVGSALRPTLTYKWNGKKMEKITK
jgi:hypothetical protein